MNNFKPTYFHAGVYPMPSWQGNVRGEPVECSCCFARLNRGGYETEIRSLYGYPLRHSDTHVCDDCSNWHWMSAEEGASHDMPTASLWPTWMVGYPDEYNDSPLSMDSVWFRDSVLTGYGSAAYLSGDQDEMEVPF